MDFIIDLADKLPFLDKLMSDISTGRMVESFVLLMIIWRKLKPHLTNIENRMKGLEEAVTNGFNKGETRFIKIEERLDALEHLAQP